MKPFISISILAIFAIASCQKEIDVDLNESNPILVLEANYSAKDSTVRAIVTLTSSFFNNEPSPNINSAVATITDHLGNGTNVPSVGNGTYVLTNYIPTFGTTYTLTVVYDGVTYTAECDMNAPVTLDPITYEFFPPFFGQSGYAPYLNFQDPAGDTNYYVVVLARNDTLWNNLSDLLTQDDALTDGNYVERPLFSRDLYQIGDKVGMELRTIDGDIYNYLNDVISTAGSGQSSAAPGNPDSNWDNGALGYFSCYSSSEQTVIIQ